MTATPPTASTDRHEIFVGDGEMARLMRAHPWEQTSLGPPEAWPNALKVAVRILLTSRFDMWLGWGPDIAFLYNDAYRPTLGIKHPASLATPTKVLWAEIWPDIEPRLRAVYERGEATWDRALLLLLERSGYPEETYHTFSYSPLMGDTGQVEGILCAVAEETFRVISERRLTSLRELAEGLSGITGRAAVIQAVCSQLALNQRDMPFSLTYLFDADGQPALACATGVPDGHPFGEAAFCPWDLSGIWSGEAAEPVALDPRSDPPSGAWDAPPTAAAIVPLLGQGEDRPFGAMVVGLNPYRPFDGDYRSFLQLLGGQIASGLASAQAYEAAQQRAEALAEAVRLRQAAADALASEVQLRTRERDQMRGMFQQAPSFMAVLRGPDHVFELANDAYLQLVGHRQLVGLSVREAVPEIAGQGYFELLDQVFGTGEAFVGTNLPALLQREQGAPLEQRILQLIYQPILDPDGSVYGIFVDGYDVTEVHEAQAALTASEAALRQINETLEQRVSERTDQLIVAQEALRQSQKLDAMGQLTGGVAHDFNNLLTPILGALDLLHRRGLGGEREQRLIDGALQSAERARTLVQRLLAFARRQPLQTSAVDVTALVHGMADLVASTSGPQIKVVVDIADQLPAALTDPHQLEMAILNLSVNARDAMPDGGTLRISATDEAVGHDHRSGLAPGAYVRLSVADTGVGMDEPTAARAIEPFFSTKGIGKGTGLGLSMVHGLVSQLGGAMAIASRPGLGTNIDLWLPASLEPARPDLADPVVRPEGRFVGAALLVDDESLVRATTADMLAELGYRVAEAPTAAEALGLLDRQAFDLVVTDHLMPGMTGADLAREVQARHPGTPILIISGYAESEGIAPHLPRLTKPFRKDDLAASLAALPMGAP